MNNPLTTTLAANRFRYRAGNALVATLIISVTVGLALNLSSDRMQGLQAISRLDEGRQQARLAAESIGTVLEGRLKNEFTDDNNTFTRKVVEGPYPGWALGFPGYAGQGSTNTPGLWFGKCLIRWRIEPVKVWSTTIANQNDIPAGGKYALNPNSDSSNLENDSDFKDLVASDPNFLKQNENNFMFRIVTDAYYMGDNLNKDAKPWLGTGTVTERAICRAQAVRVVQYTLVNLFDYTIFYAATGPTGDLEFWQGTGMAVKGRVHSNGAIYIGGGGQGQMSGLYHTAASGNGGLSIGTASEPSTVTAVDGIFRMRKPANYVAAARGVGSASRDPMAIPKTGLSGENDFNGDTPSDGKHTINGVKFTSGNDSRSKENLEGDFKKLVRDKYTGASVVTSLANAPQFGGFPFEAQRFGSDTDLLYVQAGVLPPVAPLTRGVVTFSLDQNNPAFGGAGGVPVYYTQNPLLTQAPSPLTLNPAASFNPGNPMAAAVRATNLPLYWQNAARTIVDVTQPAIGAFPQADQFDDYEARGAIFAAEIIPNNNLRTGLIIRERPVQTPILVYPGALPATPTPAQWTAMAAYLSSQYQVIFAQQDITAAFFGDLTRTTVYPQFPARASAADAIATEDMMINRREANFMLMFYGQNPTNFSGVNAFNPTTAPNGVNHQYRVNLLTLNLRRVQDFIARMQMRDLHPTAWVGDRSLMKTRFTGVIYAHRTRRSATYHPITRPHMVFNPNVAFGSTSVTLTPRTTYTPPALLSGYPNQVREGSGPIETFHCAIRIRGGLDADGGLRPLRSAVNWEHDADNDGDYDNSPLGTSKTTVISPNPVYLWGDINTVPYSDGTKEQRTPVAVFGDAVNLLSAAWSDASVPLYTSAIPAATHTSYASSFVINNVPCLDWNAAAEGTGAVANVCRFLENWGGGGLSWPNPLGISQPGNYGGQVVYTFKGSLVVMNQQRYSRAVLGAGTTGLNNASFYSPPFRNLAYNSDLKLADGKPPQAPDGVEPIRVVSTVNIFDY